MTNARTVEQIIADGARPESAEQQAQVERWQERHNLAGTVILDDMLADDESEAYAADGFMTSTRRSPMPVREPGRAQIIAAIHAYADFLADHPDVPAPQYLTANAHYRREDEPDTEMRIALVKNWADRQGLDMERLPTCVYAELVIAWPLMHGIKITHTVLTVTSPERAL
jgi:hypothetical protein